MPNFNLETLQAVKELYLQHLGYIPPLIENADAEITLLNQDKFIASLPNKPDDSSISSQFIGFLKMMGLQVELITDEQYCTPIHLVLKEFFEWTRSIKIENSLQESADVEARLVLYKALFLSEKNLMAISPDNIRKFSYGLVGCQNAISSAKRQLDIFDVHPVINDETTKLSSAFESFNAQWDRSYNDPFVMYLYTSLDSEVERLTRYFRELSNVFDHTRSKGWLLEQERQDMRVRSEVIAHQIDRVKQGMESIFNQAQRNPQMLISAKEAKNISGQITYLFTKISIGIDLIKWKIGTDLGRLSGIRKQSGLQSCWGLNSHQRQNPLTDVDEEVLTQSFGG